MNQSTCAACVFWQRFDSVRRSAQDARPGLCRRHAPRPAGGPPGEPPVHWPTTRPTDWCGEFEAMAAAGLEPAELETTEAVTVVQRETVRRPRAGQVACRGLVCIADNGTKLVVWGRDDNMHNLHIVNRARLPCRVSFAPTEPEGWSQERYGDTWWVEPEAPLEVRPVRSPAATLHAHLSEVDRTGT